MTDFSALLQQGVANAWLFVPSAILLGALHGLEPGHSKTMMAAFIVAIRGTVRQAVMLGLAATLSHTAIVWMIALGGMYISRKFTAESAEPWFQLISAVIILGTAAWMFWRTWSGERLWKLEQEEEHAHGHHEHDETRIIDTGHGKVELSIFEEGQLPHWRFRTLSGQNWQTRDVSLVTNRGKGTFSQVFDFVEKDGFMESTQAIPEPHSFEVRLTLGHRGHVHDYDVTFHEHEHEHSALEGLDASSKEYQDAHEKAHANDIKKRFANRNVTTGQIILFGLTGGLIPCPAAITVLLLCIQVKEFSLGAALVLCFSIGLAITLVTVGAAAAYSVRQATKRWRGFDTLARRAPYFSSVLIALVGIYMGYHGWSGIMQ
ncbi:MULTISPECIES: nickel/cobalt efflux protein RcnA [Enterobacterales]|jgi:nickel/cobalt exporter|uniref:Nickel/cobalt efflux system n=2 Tax=Enterobacteriaceae TaxID=543 RepID=A0A726I840_SALET|nr:MULTISPECIES: nickel/cobalt efflux protein RcnA [Enterobacterales]EDQ2357577.1 nickel/cobalt efflux protein RcnA [Salmonella enterica subsp. enterica]EDT3010147.1 nickel/cobalt efflux protein RcnA [Salmonella enterica subsp. enterica serovar Java]EFB2395075.1 nickel/cobalt efflux protein RcnA [Escherichia coli]EHJ4094825.1 nickel/cobalt efflux protein RcnA [Escherichia fergusonii]EIR9815669.1 nickel/cobalt efflux protein RcnA [Salmonella enterica subsp. enterica serovar Heidelberg]MBP82553